MPPNKIIDEDTTDGFLQKPVPKYEGGKTLEEKVKELGIETRPMKLPRPESLDED
jgi:hypothetical protein